MTCPGSLLYRSKCELEERGGDPALLLFADIFEVHLPVCKMAGLRYGDTLSPTCMTSPERKMLSSDSGEGMCKQQDESSNSLGTNVLLSSLEST